MAEIDQDKINSVMNYLKKEFPECTISNTKSFEYKGQSFTITCGDDLYLLTINKSFFEENSTDKIFAWLPNSDLKKELLKNPGRRQVVRMNGEVKDYGEVEPPSR
jgi:hypothetical protein